MDFQLVLNARTDCHGNGPWREDVKAEKRRSELFQILGSGKKGEYFRERTGEPGFRLESEDFHGYGSLEESWAAIEHPT